MTTTVTTAPDEAAANGRTYDALLADRVPHREVIVFPNGCTDDTVEVALPA